jgi:hypothetical protein
MAIVLPTLPEPAPGETETRFASTSKSRTSNNWVADSVRYHDGDMEVQWSVISGEYTKGK